MARVAIVTAREAEPLDTDLPLLRAALERLGIGHTTVFWDERRSDWDTFSLAVVRSTWNYVPHRDAFLAWARSVSCPLRNTPDVLAWNTDKTYLAELERQGVGIVPTAWFRPGDDVRRLELDKREGELVIKPTVSAGAKDTARYRMSEPESAALAEKHVLDIAASGRTAMVQPYIASVDRRGETGMLFFAGERSHAIEKGAILRGERHDVGGLFAAEKIAVRQPSLAEIAFAERVLAAIPFPTPLYARIDVVEDDRGEPRLLELELAEPSVFLDMDPKAADRFARAIERELA